MQKRKGGLGRGLGSLIPQGPAAGGEETDADHAANHAQVAASASVAPAARQAAPHAQDSPLAVPTGAIVPNPHQPRQALAPDELEELADSIREHGVLQPLLVTRPAGGDSYVLVAGERRWRAAMKAGLDTVPVVVKEASSRQMLEMALVENLQRADLNPLEEASAYRALVDEFGLKQEEVAARVGKSRVAVGNSLRLLKLPEPILEALAQGQITEGHARALLQVPGETEQVWLLQKIIADGLNVRQVEAFARKLAERAEQAEKADASETREQGKELFDENRALEDRFRDVLGTRVQLSRSSRGGKLVIYFYSNEELDRIYGTIVGQEQ